VISLCYHDTNVCKPSKVHIYMSLVVYSHILATYSLKFMHVMYYSTKEDTKVPVS